MLINPAQQSANRTATCIELSDNWRTKIDTPPTTGNNDATPTACLEPKPGQRQQRDFGIESRKKRDIGPMGTAGEEPLRGEDHPNTLQAIAEGRRLYTGKMPYIAKSEDVEVLICRE